jgi:hypothetical protein
MGPGTEPFSRRNCDAKHAFVSDAVCAVEAGNAGRRGNEL